LSVGIVFIAISVGFIIVHVVFGLNSVGVVHWNWFDVWHLDISSGSGIVRSVGSLVLGIVVILVVSGLAILVILGLVVVDVHRKQPIDIFLFRLVVGIVALLVVVLLLVIVLVVPRHTDLAVGPAIVVVQHLQIGQYHVPLQFVQV